MCIYYFMRMCSHIITRMHEYIDSLRTDLFPGCPWNILILPYWPVLSSLDSGSWSVLEAGKPILFLSYVKHNQEGKSAGGWGGGEGRERKESQNIFLNQLKEMKGSAKQDLDQI